MAEPIRISALGRDAQVGDLYNYFTDVIIPNSWIDVPNGRKTISNTVGDPELLFLYQQSENCKLHLLGINSHLLQNMKRGSVPGHQLWFDDYINTNSMDGDEEHAQVTLLFRVVRRTETLDLDFLRSKIDDYQIISADESATHVIDEVVYGAELICSMRKALDLSQETKESAEVSIYFAAKKYLDDTIGKSTNLELPAELDQVSCTVLSSIEPGKKNEMSFDSFNLYLQNLLNTGNNRQKWKPMEFRLQNMSVALIEAKLWSERKADIALEKEHHQVSIKWISKEMLDISNDPSLKRFPLLETFICYFRDLLPRFWKGIDEAYETFEMLPEEKALEEMTYISDWLKRVMDLFACRRKDIREMCWLLKDTDLVLQDMQVIEAQMKTKDCKIAKLFVLNLEYKQVPIVNDIEELVGQQTSTAMLPVLPIFSCEKEQIGCIRSVLSQFANEARLAKLSSAHGTSYYVGLESSMLENGAVKILDYSGISPVIISEDNLVEYLQKKQKHQLPASSSSVSACLPTPLTPTVASKQNQQLKMDKDSELTNTNYKENSTAKLSDNDETVRDNEAYFSDIDVDYAGYSQHPTGSTKANSSLQQVNSAATIVDQKDPTGFITEAERLNLQMDQLQLSDAKAKEQLKTVAVQPMKNLNDGESKEQNSRVNKPKSCTDERYTETHPLSFYEKGCMTQYQGRSEKIVDGIGKGKVHEDYWWVRCVEVIHYEIITLPSPNTDRESNLVVTSNYSQAYSKGQTTLPPPVYSHDKAKPVFLKRFFLGNGNTEESDNRLPQEKK
ncbi:hypothetical protein GHT06_004667 [Daphnia sinensis]|nr:hypothetical protein GHT06_004667 [Daphnia sinensis]